MQGNKQKILLETLIKFIAAHRLYILRRGRRPGEKVAAKQADYLIRTALGQIRQHSLHVRQRDELLRAGQVAMLCLEVAHLQAVAVDAHAAGSLCSCEAQELTAAGVVNGTPAHALPDGLLFVQHAVDARRIAAAYRRAEAALLIPAEMLHELAVLCPVVLQADDMQILWLQQPRHEGCLLPGGPQQHKQAIVLRQRQLRVPRAERLLRQRYQLIITQTSQVLSTRKAL